MTSRSALGSMNATGRTAFRMLGALLLWVLEEQIARLRLTKNGPKRIDAIRALMQVGTDGSKKEMGDTSALWREWQKGKHGKGCFASANVTRAIDMVQAADAMGLFNWTDLPEVQQGAWRQNGCDSGCLKEAFAFLGGQYLKETEIGRPFARIDGVILRLARMSYLPESYRDLDQISFAEFFDNDSGTGLLRINGEVQLTASYDLSPARRSVLQAAVDARDAVEALWEDMERFQAFINFEAPFKDGAQPSGIHLSVRMKILEGHLQNEFEGLFKKAQSLCEEIYPNKKNAEEQTIKIIRRCFKELLNYED